MIKNTSSSIIERLRRAGAAPATSPNIPSILARAAERKRRRQIGITAASVVIVGGLGLGSAQLLAGSTDASISAAGVSAGDVNAMAVSAATPEPTIPADSAPPSADDPASHGWTATPTTTAVRTTTTVDGVPRSFQAARPVELADQLGGAITVDSGQLMHRMATGDTMIIDLPPMYTTTERRITDIAMLDDRPFMLISDFTDRPDLVVRDAAIADPDDLHQELSIYAVDLVTNDVYVVEERTITEQHSPEWVYNGHVTTSGNHIMVVRELWQSMCVYVDSLDLSGQHVKTAENPLPEPSVASLSSETISAMQAGLVEPPRGCIAATELPDGAMSVLGVQADSATLEAVNAQLRSAAALTAEAVSD